MVQDKNLVSDEARRKAQHGDAKAALQSEVNRAVVAEARVEARDVGVADSGRALARSAIDEVAATEREVVRARSSARGAQILDYVFFVIYGLIVIEIVLEAAGARDANGFKVFMDTVTTPFLAPFRGLFSDPAIGHYRIMYSYIAALVAWILVHLAIRGLIRVIGHRKTTL